MHSDLHIQRTLLAQTHSGCKSYFKTNNVLFPAYYTTYDNHMQSYSQIAGPNLFMLSVLALQLTHYYNIIH